MVKKALGKHHKKPLLKTETAGKWSFIPLTYGMIGLDPYPYVCVCLKMGHTQIKRFFRHWKWW